MAKQQLVTETLKEVKKVQKELKKSNVYWKVSECAVFILNGHNPYKDLDQDIKDEIIELAYNEDN